MGYKNGILIFTCTLDIFVIHKARKLGQLGGYIQSVTGMYNGSFSDWRQVN